MALGQVKVWQLGLQKALQFEEKVKALQSGFQKAYCFVVVVLKFMKFY